MRSVSTAAVLGALAVSGLGGCVSLLPKAEPAQLYSFGQGAAQAPPSPSPLPAGEGPATLVLAEPTRFAEAEAGDRILTVRGQDAAYVAHARWISPAASLFTDAETAAFDTPGQSVRLVRPGQGGAPSLSLRLDVRTFEASYGPGTGPPVVIVVVGAELSRLADRQVLGARTFESRRPAAAERVGAIVAAFEDADSDVLSRIAAWTSAQAATPVNRALRPQQR